MTENVIVAKEYAERAERVIGEHPDIAWIANEGVRIAYLASDREKKSSRRPVCGQCIKVPGIYKALLPYDFLIVIYEANTEGFTDAELDVLLYHELLHVGMNDKGEYRINPHNVEDFYGILNRYGLDWSSGGIRKTAEGLQTGGTQAEGAGGDPDGEGQI